MPWVLWSDWLACGVLVEAGHGAARACTRLQGGPRLWPKLSGIQHRPPSNGNRSFSRSQTSAIKLTCVHNSVSLVLQHIELNLAYSEINRNFFDFFCTNATFLNPFMHVVPKFTWIFFCDISLKKQLSEIIWRSNFDQNQPTTLLQIFCVLRLIVKLFLEIS